MGAMHGRGADQQFWPRTKGVGLVFCKPTQAPGHPQTSNAPPAISPPDVYTFLGFLVSCLAVPGSLAGSARLSLSPAYLPSFLCPSNDPLLPHLLHISPPLHLLLLSAPSRRLIFVAVLSSSHIKCTAFSPCFLRLFSVRT